MLFEKKGRSNSQRLHRNSQKGAVKQSQLLRPNEKTQHEMVVGGIADMLAKIAEGRETILCLPGAENCFEPTAQYGIDGVTEKLHLFRCKKEDEVKIVVRRYLTNLQQKDGSGLLAL